MSHRDSVKTDSLAADQIPALPSLASRIIEVSFDDHCNYREMAVLIRQDPVLSARILTLVNSPSLALTSRIRDLSHAISILGRKQVRNLALSVSLFDTFSTIGRQRETEMIAFWRHCIACAHACEGLARKLKYPEPEEAFLAGLLHDIGKLILYHSQPDAFNSFLQALRELPAKESSPWCPMKLEERFLPLPHHLAGKRAAEKWHFPESISDAVWLHHQPPAGPRSLPPSLPLLVRLADAFCNLHNLGANYFINHQLNYSTARSYVYTVESLKLFLQLEDEFLNKLYQQTDFRLNEFDNCLETVDNRLYFATIHKAHQELGRLNRQREREIAELNLKNRLLEALAAINRQALTSLELPDLTREIVAQARHLCSCRFAFCVLSHDEDAPACWYGCWGDEVYDQRRLATEPVPSRVQSGKNSRPSRKTRILATLRRLVMDKSEALLKNSRITPLKEHPSILVVPLIDDSGPGFQSTIYGQLLVDCRELAHQLLPKGIIIESINRFTAGICELLRQYRLISHINSQAEKISEICRHSEEIQFELLQAQRLATVGRLATGAAHEINNPLTVISGQLQILKNQALKEGRDEKELQRYEKMLEKVDKISRIVGDLLSYGRPQKPQRQPVFLDKAVNQALESVKHRSRFTRIDCHIEIPAKLPPALVDQQQLGQILINLLINAELAMPEEGGRITIIAREQKTERMLSLAISDTGHGIEAKILPSIFDPFFTTRDGNQGTGLGLSIVHSLVEANHGRISVSSVPDQGTTFTIQLPVALGVGRPEIG